jgi:glycine dehydrogenase subunit 1
MHPYLPHTPQDERKMVKAIGVTSVEELFQDVPQAIRMKEKIQLPPGKSEYEVIDFLRTLSNQNKQGISFLGCGSYDHYIPSVVHHITGRSEFTTAYTPYQAEISQGVLQAIFEFQTFMCRLTGLDVSNAGLYDGHTAAYEASVIALNSVRKTDTILYSSTIHPFTKKVLTTYFGGTEIACVEIKEDRGVTSIKDLEEKLTPSVAAVILQSPNTYGYLEDVTDISSMLEKTKGIFILSSNPLSLGILKTPAQWGADIAIGDTQPLGLQSYFGGPSVGYITAREKYIRKMPGRIAGETVDQDGKRGFVLTLQAREQHIRREKASSNICSNQALAALANSVYCALMGKEGMKEVARRNLENAHYLYEKLIKVPGITSYEEREFFNEFTLILKKSPKLVVTELMQKGFLAGVPRERLTGKDNKQLTLAVTEKRTQEEMDSFVNAMKEELS